MKCGGIGKGVSNESVPIFLHTVSTSLHDSFFVTVDLLI